ncbi:hypothetical protein [Parabacteroides sp. TM07-1AC]|uniref:hypothetical protein n=1 Tax=Parabacteroides sp. TM07-1AC TaxID=2292363 RepID=UPI0018F2B553|nr:hypothetical protein [Parabacteroides sp. TM07-1AC]
MEIKRGNIVVCDVYLKNNSCTVEEIMGEHTLTLNFLSRKVVDLHINDYVDFEGNIYKIRHNEKVVKRETSLGYEYNVTLYSGRYDLEDVIFFLNGKPEFKKNFDYYTGTARDWLNLFVKNMNREDPGWSAGSCIESRMITLSFKDKSVGAVLDEFVKELDTEYWISGKTMSIGKREYSSNGLVLAQGEGLGFTELEISAVEDVRPTTVIFPYGSDKNLGSGYGADYLMLPGGLTELSKNTDKYGRLGQKKIQFDHIFPQGEFTVTDKIDTLTLKCDVDFNLKDCLIDDVEVIVTFQSGGLAGYDLAIVEGSWDNSKKQFKLKENKEENALTVPGDINFSVGDKFILTGLKMPQSYIDKAEKQLQEEAQKWLDEHCEKRVQLRGKCDEGLFRQLNLFIACGQMVGVYSEQLKINREIRVTKVKRYIENDNKPTYRYELTLSDFLESNGFKDMVDDVNKVPDEIEDKVKPVREWTKRSWRDVMETLGMMFDPEGDYFTELIKPLAVHTAQLIVGTNSQQMDLIGVKFIPNADDDPNYFKSTAGKLVHFTIQEDSIREWTLPASSHRLNNSIPYYVYAKCSREGSSGSILVSERQIKLLDDASYYHFWVGVLNTPEDSVRSWLPNYGYTEIAGQTITTGVIKDKMARVVIDLINGTIYGRLNFASGTTGYENIKDKPDLSKYGTVTMINQINREILEMQADIDGKIDTYYQSSNPWQSWSSGTENEHVGDMWYNTSTGVLKTYVGPFDNNWREIVDPAAVEAAREVAEAADVKADGKRRVFLSQPRPPYDAGDQWISGYGSSEGTIRVCIQSRKSGSYYSSDWQLSSVDGNTEASIDRGVFSASGFMTFGGSAGLVGSGSIRIWSGGDNANNATFKVYNDGSVVSDGTITANDAIMLRDQQAGIMGRGNAASSIRFWAGSSAPGSAPFRVQRDGKVFGSNCEFSGGKIGRFTISSNGRLTWNQNDYFGNRSTSLKLGFSTGNEGVIDVSFNASQEGKFGVKSVGSNAGGAAIYGSRYTSPQNYPDSDTTYAGYFDGPMLATSLMTRAGGKNWTGVSFDNNIDLDNARFTVRNGLIVELWKE